MLRVTVRFMVVLNRHRILPSIRIQCRTYHGKRDKSDKDQYIQRMKVALFSWLKNLVSFHPETPDFDYREYLGQKLEPSQFNSNQIIEESVHQLPSEAVFRRTTPVGD